MIESFNHLLQRFFRTALILGICICLVAIPFGSSAYAGRTTMTGDYLKDTVTVSNSLKEIISTPQNEEEDQLEKDKETVFLITDYISRYRNRNQINDRLSFTTMQTALNSLAGHYKTFPNRPVPEKLKDRLNKELTKAEELALKKS